MLSDSEPASTPQHWSRKKIAWWICGGFVVLIVIPLLVVLAHDEDLEPWDNLKPARTTMPDPGTNGYLYLRERWEKLTWDQKEHDKAREMTFGRIPWEDALLAKRRTGREKIDGELKDALALPAFQTPIVLKMNDPDLLRMAWIAKPVSYLGMEVIAIDRAGDHSGAISLLTDLRALSIRHLEGQGSLLAFLVGTSLFNLAIEVTSELLSHGELNAAQLAALAEVWGKEIPAYECWKSAMQYEATFAAEAISSLKNNPKDVETQGIPKPPFTGWLLKLNKTLNQSRAQFRQILRTSFNVYPSLDAAKAAGWGRAEDTRSKLAKIFDPNYAGSRWLRSNDSYGNIIPQVTTSLFLNPRALRVAIAMHRWRLVHPGQWPVKLEELVPEFLSEVPQDPFNGQALLWDPATQVIFSVGSDWKAAAPVPTLCQTWVVGEHESPGLRLTRSPAGPAVIPTKGSAQPK